MKILFVGDKPSKLNTDPNVAFKGAKCEKRLNEWICSIALKAGLMQWATNNTEEYEVINRVDYNATWKIVEYWMNNWPIIVLGNEAEKFVKSIGAKYHKLPHPSGRNRLLNDNRAVAIRLAQARTYVIQHRNVFNYRQLQQKRAIQ